MLVQLDSMARPVVKGIELDIGLGVAINRGSQMLFGALYAFVDTQYRYRLEDA
jgi:hypothetical protein